MTTLIDNPALAERLTPLLQPKGRTYGIHSGRYFGDPDKRIDPFNRFARMSAEGVVNGVRRGWWVEISTVNIRGVNREEVIAARLRTDLADAIDANPGERLT
jgi:hypothetical protein